MSSRPLVRPATRATRGAALLSPAFILAAALAPATASAAGLYVPDLGVMPQGRAGAYVAKADSYLALHYNPAGLFQIKGFQIEGGLMAHGMATWFQRAGGEGKWKEGVEHVDGRVNPEDPEFNQPFAPTENLDSFRPIPELAFSYGFEKPDLTLSLGFYAPNAPWYSYPSTSPARYRMLKARLDQATYALGAAWRPVEFLSIGAALHLVAFRIEEEFDISAHLFSTEAGNDEDPQFDLRVKFQALQFPAVNGNFGLMLVPNDKVQAGVSFQPGIHMKAPGSVTIEGDLSSELLGYYGSLAPDLVDSSGIHVSGYDPEMVLETDLPPMLRAGILVRPHPRLEIEIDGVVEFWSVHDGIQASGVDSALTGDDSDDPDDEPVSLPQYLDERGICDLGALMGVDCADIPAVYKGPEGDGIYLIPEEFQDAFSVRFGIEANPVDPLVMRAGYLLETSAIPDEWMGIAAIDNLKHAVGVGAALKLDGFELGGTFHHVFYGERTLAAEDSRGIQGVAFETTVPNQIDAGTYRADVNNFGFYIRVNPTKIDAARKARKAGL